MRSGGTGTASLPSLHSNQQPASEIKDSILNRPPARRKNRHRASILLSKDGFSRGKNTKAAEEKLGEQFRYFRQEFLEAALSIGVPVPLDMVEDKAGRVYTFVNQKGPRYLFQIMHSNPESAHLLRVSLSLLIITISILRGKLPQNTPSMSCNLDNSHLTWMNLLTENVSTWALDSLTSIADGSAVAICTNLLRHSHSQTIQELILNLLAQLVNITEEAANQMLLFPTITNTSADQAGKSGNGSGGGAGSGGGSHDSKDSDGGGGNESRSNSPLAMNRSLISSGSPGHPSSLHHGLSPFPKNKRQSFAPSFPTSSVLTNSSPHRGGGSQLRSSATTPGSAIASAASGSGTGPQYTCLSYMFSVVAHHRNRYTVMTASAEVVLALIANKSPAICEGIAKTAISSSLVEVSDHESHRSSNGNGSSSHSFGSNISSRILAVESAAAAKKPKKTISFHSSSSEAGGGGGAGGAQQWAALKLMLKFLQRFMRYAVPTSTSASHTAVAVPSPSATEVEASASAAGGGGGGGEGRVEDGLPSQQKNSLCHAHSRVLLAVCELIIYSPVVASYVLSMPGARAIVKASCLLHQNSPDIASSVIGCLQVLQKESQRIYEQVSSHRHSLSYELTHGRSSKLFNPVAVLAKRDGPSPRVLTSRPSTSSAGGGGTGAGIGTTFGLPRSSSQAQLAQQQQGQGQVPLHRALSSRYSTSVNPFTTEFSLPSSPQPQSPQSPLSPHSPITHSHSHSFSKAVSRVVSGEYDHQAAAAGEGGGGRGQGQGRVDILFVHHDTEDEEEEEEEEEDEKHHISATGQTNLPFLGHPQPQPQGKRQSNQQQQQRNDNSGGMQKSCSVDSYDGGMEKGDPFDSSRRSSPPEHKGERGERGDDPRKLSASSGLGRNRIVYNPPESPPRRGLKDHQVGTEVSLHRDLFLSLPQKPAMPARLEAHDIISGHIPLSPTAHGSPPFVSSSPKAEVEADKFQYLEASLQQSLSISTDIVTSARQSGYYVNGKCSVPIVEKARRVYAPSSSIRGSSLTHARPHTSTATTPAGTSSRLLSGKPLSHRDRGTGMGGKLVSSQLSTEPPAALQQLKGVSLDGMGRLEQTSHDFEMFTQQQQPRHASLDPLGMGSSEGSGLGNQKLSEGFHHDQILQSYDVLFP